MAVVFLHIANIAYLTKTYQTTTQRAHFFLYSGTVALLNKMCVCIPILVTTFPLVAQRYGTIAAHTRRRASVLVVFVFSSVHMHNFAGLIRRTPPPTFSDTAITDRHSDTTIFQLRAHWVRISWSTGSEKIVRTCAPRGSRTLDFLRARRAPYPLGQALRFTKQDEWTKTFYSLFNVNA